MNVTAGSTTTRGSQKAPRSSQNQSLEISELNSITKANLDEFKAIGAVFHDLDNHFPGQHGQASEESTSLKSADGATFPKLSPNGEQHTQNESKPMKTWETQPRKDDPFAGFGTDKRPVYGRTEHSSQGTAKVSQRIS